MRFAPYAAALLLVSCARPAYAPLRSEAYERSLTEAVRKELAEEPFVPYQRIAVNIERGIVMLKGNVENLLARRRAQEIAETVRGVRGVVNLLEVRPAVERSDATLQQAAVEALLYNPATDAFDIRVEVDRGRARLQGSVSSFAEVALATRVVESVDGLRGVDNELSVDEQTVRSDREIQAEVEARLRADAKVDESLLQVRVKDGRVDLSGTLGRVTERNRAAADAWVRGVKQVDVQDVEIELWARDENRRVESPLLSDDAIEDAVELAFSYDPRVAGYKVDADVERGIVLLRGRVDSLDAKRAAEEDSLATTGVSAVKNEILVQTEPLADPQIARGVRRAIERHPFVDRYRILVSAEDGIVHLEGTVASEFERSIADQLAAQAPGVRGVHNDLTLRSDALETLGEVTQVPAPGADRPTGVYHQPAPRMDIPDQGMRVLPADAVVRARCQQEQRCGAVGPGQLYSDFEACRTQVGVAQRYQLDALSCQAGVDEQNLELCLVEVRTADCATPRAAGEWLGPSCSAQAICRSSVK